MSDTFIDFYSLLGIDPKATQKDIVRAFRREINEVHSDKHADADEETRAKQDELTRLVYEARDTLKDPEKRREYDTRWQAHQARRQDTKPRSHQGEQSRCSPRMSGESETPGTLKPVLWTPQTQAPAEADTGGGGVGTLLGFLVATAAAVGGAYVLSNFNTYDASVDRYRGSDGKFRPRWGK